MGYKTISILSKFFIREPRRAPRSKQDILFGEKATPGIWYFENSEEILPSKKEKKIRFEVQDGWNNNDSDFKAHKYLTTIQAPGCKD